MNTLSVSKLYYRYMIATV